jgi:peptidyl-prolyl cis-trans isomerase D
MRKHARSWLIKVALGGIIIVFVFWYGWSGPVEEQRNKVAEVNGTVITRDHFNVVYRSEEEKIRLRFKEGIPQGLLDKLNLKEKVLKGLVNQQLLIQEAKRLGLIATNEDLVEDIRSNPLFQRNGVFDQSIYAGYLRQIKLNPSAYEQLRRQELLEAQVVALLTDAVKTDPQEIKNLWHFQNDRLILSMLVVSAEKAQDKATISPEALEAYFKKNQKKYEFPPSVDLQYVSFSWQDFQKDFSVDEAEARSFYANHPPEFVEPERIRARHILLKVPEDADKEKVEEIRKKMDEILARIKGGEEFEQVAAAESQDESTAGKGGDLGFFSRGTMNPQMEDIAFKLEPGEISKPFKTKQGYELIKIEERKAEEPLDFEVVKEKIEKKLLEEKARKKVADVSESFYEKVYRMEDLEEPAKQFGLAVKKADSATKAQGLIEVGAEPQIMEEAFQLKTGEISKLIKSGDNFLVMKLVKKTPERLPQLDEVHRAVENDYLEEQALSAARKKAEEIIEALKESPEDSDAVAKRFGLRWEKLDPVSRTTGLVPRLGSSPEVIEMMTTISKAMPVFPIPLPLTGGVAVVHLTDEERASEELYEKERRAFERWIVEVRKAEFLQGWLRILEERSQITLAKNL